MENRQQTQPQEQSTTVAVPTKTWVKPTFEVIEVSLECTAYAGTLDDEE